jgi:competence protein ComEC
MKSLFIAILLIWSGQASAQYLETYNSNSSLRKAPKSGAEKVIGSEMDAKEKLALLDSGKQTNGYYHASILGTSLEGWIYRSQVKRIEEALPRFLDDRASLEVYVVDVGAGLGCIIKTPSGKYLIYDGGNGNYVHKFLSSKYAKGKSVEYVIVSHTDTDHWDAIEEIARDYQVKNALYTSYRPDTMPGTVARGIKALQNPSTKWRDLAEKPISPDSIIYKEDGITLTFLSGFGDKDEAFASELGKDAAKLRNAASIVIKLEYAGQSILFTGDIVGLDECEKPNCDCEQTCIATERYLLDHVIASLESDVIIAPHHGARNASCPDFIEAVNPEYVIFSAGNKHNHPHQVSTTNYLNFGVALDHIFRTDVGAFSADGDKNPCNDEWNGENANLTGKDKSFDDHIKIQITSKGRLLVGYLD